MFKYIPGCIVVGVIILLSGCCTTRTATIGMAESLVTDAVITYKGLEEADKWFQENYW